MPAHSWHTTDHLRELQTARLTGQVDPRRPSRGIHHLRVDQDSLGDVEVLQVGLRQVDADASAEAIDEFIRGGDLAITYPARPEPAMRTQLYWRATSHPLAGAIAAIELVVSVQTSLLDSCPTLHACSRLPIERAFRLCDLSDAKCIEMPLDFGSGQQREEPAEPCGYLFHLAGTNFSYAEMVHPADSHRAQLDVASETKGPLARLDHELFAGRLEKGVILRARVLGLLLDRRGDVQAAAQHFAAFLTAELPLTT